MHEHTPPDTHAAAQEFWDARYGERSQFWSGRVNQSLADVAAGLTPGTALDLGCGEGGDSIWLAESGWTVTGVDVSATALARARDAAASRGIDAGRVRWEQIDLTEGFVSGSFDLVSACFLASPIHLPRPRILQRAAAGVAAGGTLLVVSHAAPPPWARHHHGPADFPTPAEELDALALDAGAWDIDTAEVKTRNGTGPDGEHAQLSDTVVVARRR